MQSSPFRRECVYAFAPMPSPTRPALATLTILVAIFIADPRAQLAPDPHLPPPRALPALSEYVRVDDMLLWPDQYEQLIAAPTSRRQANIQALGQRQLYWEWGVVPYEVAPNFSDTERQRLRQAMDSWGRTAPIVFVRGRRCATSRRYSKECCLAEMG